MTGSALPTCSVVVCTHDRPEALDACLAAISAGTRSASEVVVVDSAPTDGNTEPVAARWGARYIIEKRPGVSRARNRAAAETASEVIAFVDDDAVPEPGWLEPLLAGFSDSRVAVVTGRVLPPEADMALLPSYAWLGVSDLGPEPKAFDRSVPGWYTLTNFGGAGLGASIAFRRSVFEGWGGFDERLGAGTRIPGHEELKAFFELVERGWRVVYAPGSVVRHAFPHSRPLLKRRALMAIEASAAYLTLLLLEQPAHRRETWGYIRHKLGRVSPVYTRETDDGKPLVPGYRVMAARLKGVCRYFITRISHGDAS